MSKKTKDFLSPKTIAISIVACAFLCLAGLGYLWQKTQIYALGRQIKTLEVELDKLQTANQALDRAYAAMCSPRELDARVRKLNLGLSSPQPDQIVRLVEPYGTPQKAQVAARETGELNN